MVGYRVVMDLLLVTLAFAAYATSVAWCAHRLRYARRATNALWPLPVIITSWAALLTIREPNAVSATLSFLFLDMSLLVLTVLGVMRMLGGFDTPAWEDDDGGSYVGGTGGDDGSPPGPAPTPLRPSRRMRRAGVRRINRQQVRTPGGPRRMPGRTPRQPGTRMSRMRAKLYARQGGRCYYCDRDMTLRTFRIQDQLRDEDVTVEHLVPRVLGGRDIPQNLVAACHGCNRIGARIDKWAVDTFGGRRVGRV
jgi:5-methylcytosine-specific restriction endonuclease McrA